VLEWGILAVDGTANGTGRRKIYDRLSASGIMDLVEIKKSDKPPWPLRRF
jgi:hypothetical protein